MWGIQFKGKSWVIDEIGNRMEYNSSEEARSVRDKGFPDSEVRRHDQATVYGIVMV